MAQPESKSPNGAPPPAPSPVLASSVANTTLQIVQMLETLPEVAQRRIIEGVRVALGLAVPPQPRPPQQQQPRRGNGQ